MTFDQTGTSSNPDHPPDSTISNEGDGLWPHHWEMIREALRAVPSISAAWLFGSRARGTHRPYSDIDLALEGDVTLLDLAKLEEEFEESQLPFIVDALALQLDVKGKIKEGVLTEGILVYPEAGP